MKPPSVYLLNTLLRKQGIQRDALRLATACSRHPLPHSIRALSDTLDELQVPNLVCKLEFEQLAEIDGAYIVAAGKTEYPFYLVEKGTGLAGSSVCGPVQVGGLRFRKSGFAALGTARCSWRKKAMRRTRYPGSPIGSNSCWPSSTGLQFIGLPDCSFCCLVSACC